jgi:hypothetical protein
VSSNLQKLEATTPPTYGFLVHVAGGDTLIRAIAGILSEPAARRGWYYSIATVASRRRAAWPARCP